MYTTAAANNTKRAELCTIQKNINLSMLVWMSSSHFRVWGFCFLRFRENPTKCICFRIFSTHTHYRRPLPSNATVYYLYFFSVCSNCLAGQTVRPFVCVFVTIPTTSVTTRCDHPAGPTPGTPYSVPSGFWQSATRRTASVGSSKPPLCATAR